MLKQLLVGGTVLAGLTGMGLTTPAYANGWPSPIDNHTAAQSGNVVVCGNRGIGAIYTVTTPTGAVSFANNEAVDCSFRIMH